MYVYIHENTYKIKRLSNLNKDPKNLAFSRNDNGSLILYSIKIFVMY